MEWNAPAANGSPCRVRVIAPSGSFNRERFNDGIAILQAAGFEVSFDDGVFSTRRYFAGSDVRRQQEIQTALQDPDVDVLWAARGGYGAIRASVPLTAQEIRAAGKWLVGFSDVTALHGLWARAHLASIHGANVTTLATWTEEARQGLFDILSGAPEGKAMGRPGPGGRVSGRLWGGNLIMLASMVGTNTMPRVADGILFLEDVGEKPYRLDRAITQLRLSDHLEDVVGVAIGQLTDCGEGDGAYDDAVAMLADCLAPLGIPVVGGFTVGHDPSSHALPLGTWATLCPEEGSLAWQLPPTRSA